MDRKLLRIYLQDHFAGATAGQELAARAASSNDETEFGPVLAKIRDEIATDRSELEKLMESLEMGPDRLKNAAAWTAEKAGRLKPNGSLRSYSPLSRIVELEGLTIGVRGKQSLWEILREVSKDEPALAKVDFDALVKRADSQLRRLKTLRLKAARVAFESA